ncbi:regulator of chromosome condensation-like isoform X2 [Zophobas morio]|uniref:regulator of chromosome condensation-like isoform X2 n=1 Tax=Zophobas morio TaxID=2755281 RepID=UPI00308273C1
MSRTSKSNILRKTYKDFVKLKPAICTAGTPLVCGIGSNGQLGFEINQKRVPGVVPFFAENNIKCVQVDPGALHTAFLTKDGKLYTCGVNDQGALGRKTTNNEEDEYMPKLVNLDCKIISVACGDSHTLALSEDGVVYQWGNYRGTFGTYGIFYDNINDTSCIIEPQVILDLSPTDQVVQIACGQSHSLALTRRGRVYTWGCHEGGLLGRFGERVSLRNNRYKALSLKPMQLSFKQNPVIVAIYAGGICSWAKSSKGAIFGWGINLTGQLGSDGLDEVLIPKEVVQFRDIDVVDIQGGGTHTLILAKNGKVYSCDGKFGKLGRSNSEEIFYRKLRGPIEEIRQLDFKRPVVEHPIFKSKRTKETVEMHKKGIPTMFRERNSYDDQTGKNSLVPVCFEENLKIVKIGCKYDSSFAIDAAGNAYAWGFGENEQLGNAKKDESISSDEYLPVRMKSKVLKDRKVLMISCGAQHTCLLAYP